MKQKVISKLFFLLLVLLTVPAASQTIVVDSLKSLLVNENDLEKKIELLNNLFYEYQSNDYKQALKYSTEALKLSQAIDKDERKTKNLISQSANNVGASYLLLDQYEESLKYLLIALKNAESIQDTSRMSNALYNIGVLYDYKGEEVIALEYLERSIKLEEKSGNLEAAAYGYSSLAADYFFKPDYNKGMVYYDKAMKIANSINDLELKSLLYENRAVGLKHLNKYDEALKYHQMAMVIEIELNNPAGLETSYLNIADLYIKMNNNKKAVEFNLKSLKIALMLKSTNNIMKAYSGLAESYQQMGNKDKALENLQLYANWKDTLYEQQNVSAMAEMQTKYDTEKKEAENNLLKAEKQLDKVEIDRKSAQQKMLLVLLGMVLLVVGYVVYSLNQKKKTNKLLNAQNEEITTQHAIIEEKNKDITDSINYAQRIQDAILPEESLLKSSYESFIYYRPKDIVSGDFYWIKEVGNKMFFSVVDCTGHGVPGAFMSIIGANSLNKIVEDLKLEAPGEILDELNRLVNKSLGRKDDLDGKIASIRDGMDIAICSIDKQNNILEYSGANNSLYLLRKPQNKIDGIDPIMENEDTIFYEFKSNKMAIGGGTNFKKYDTHSVQLKKEDTIYLFSDGYADQFGGPKGKKFMSKSFKRMFLSIQEESMEQQLSYIDKTMNEWKGDMEQLDDICVMGVRV